MVNKEYNIWGAKSVCVGEIEGHTRLPCNTVFLDILLPETPLLDWNGLFALVCELGNEATKSGV